MFSDKSFDYDAFRQSLGEQGYKSRYIPTNKTDYISQMIDNEVSLKIYLSSIKEYPLKSENIIKINELQQRGIFKNYGIVGLRDFPFNDNPANGVMQTCDPSRIKGELKVLDLQVEKMWKKSKTVPEKVKTLSFQAARLLSLQAFDDANKRAIKATLDHSIKKLIQDEGIKIDTSKVSWDCISSLSCKQAIHGNNLGKFSKEICKVYNLDDVQLKISDYEIPPYQIMAKTPSLDNLRINDNGIGVKWKEKELDLKNELKDSVLHKKLFTQDPNDKIMWVRPSYLNDRVDGGLIKESGFFKKASSFEKLLKPMTREKFLTTLKETEIPTHVKQKIAYTPLVSEIKHNASAAAQAAKIFPVTPLSDIKRTMGYIDIKEANYLETKNKLRETSMMTFGKEETLSRTQAETKTLSRSKTETKGLRERIQTETKRKTKGLAR